ncbi:protein phosphatase 2C domain-containing protein [Pantanalinema rosaneae CENA516]|uniref:protein phosphatase 2C domain-containing protein n=1 Tax=Pantanalinema rosaneae TaxID=1620701 RepID=UPI003D6F0556
MSSQWEVAAGSVIGREHLRVGKNNQDAWHWQTLGDITIAVVCDGCSSGTYSEVGATLGVRLVTNAIAQTLQIGKVEQPGFWSVVQQGVLQQLSQLVFMLDGDSLQGVYDHLLFTIVGAVITPTVTTLFTIGDGVLLLNGEEVSIPTFPSNAPPYLAYGLLEPSPIPPEQLPFQVHGCLPTDRVRSLVIGTDGVKDLITVADQPLPGKLEPVGKIEQFWQHDRYFQNPDQLRRRLSLINREVIQTDWQQQQLYRVGGLLPDDTTLIVIRRKLEV